MATRLYVWVSHHKALILFVLLLLGLNWAIGSWKNKPLPTVTRTVGTSTQSAVVMWVGHDLMASPIASNTAGMIFALSLDRDHLVALSAKDGTTLWQTAIPFERAGVRGMTATDNAVFVISTLYADAYEATTGQLLWSTKLGTGHVSVIPQYDIDAGVLRVYYGNKLYEIAPTSGEVLVEKPNGGVYWILDKVTLYVLVGQKLMALDQVSNEQLWTKGGLFFIDEGQEPKRLSKDVLLVAEQTAGTSNYTAGICALSLRTGDYLWCRPETYVSNLAIDSQSQMGYALRGDFVLVTIDLQDGSILGETSFLPSALPEELLHFSHDYSVTFSDGVVVVAFSDSGQTFGLSMKKATPANKGFQPTRLRPLAPAVLGVVERNR